MPEDTAHIYENTEWSVSRSIIERIPVEKPLADAVRQFKKFLLGSFRAKSFIRTIIDESLSHKLIVNPHFRLPFGQRINK